MSSDVFVNNNANGSLNWNNPLHGGIDFYIWLDVLRQHYVKKLSVTCGRILFFREYCGFFHPYNWRRHDITDILFNVMLSDHNLFLCLFSFGHCSLCLVIYGFWLPLWYLQKFFCTSMKRNIICEYWLNEMSHSKVMLRV